MNGQETHRKVAYLYLLGKWKLETIMKYQFTSNKRAKIKRLITYASKYVEQLELSDIAVESVKWYTYSKELFGNFL